MNSQIPPSAGLKTPLHNNDWKTQRLKFLFRRLSRPACNDHEVVTAFRDGVVTRRSNRREDGFTFADKEIGYQGIQRGDLAIHAMDGFAGAIGVSDSEGKVSPVLSVLEPRDVGKADPHFWAYYLRNLAVSGYISSLAKGIRERSTDFRWKDAGDLLVNHPDLPTQKRIAAFLDRETARIDELIAKKERLVAVLRESLLSELERLVTPDTPIHDQLIPFRWVCRITEGQVDPTAPEWADKPLIAPNHIESRTGRLIAIETAQDQGAISGKYAFPSGTVLYSKIRPNLAKACVSTVEGMCSADMYPVLPDKRLSPQFLLMQLLSEKFTDWATLESMRVAMPKINRETLGSYRLWVPALDVQEKAAAAFFVAQTQNEALSDKVIQSIDCLREYRAALITAAVTGQIDVGSYGKSGTPSATLDRIEEEMQG